MTKEELNKTIARVILSTKRKSRQYNLIEIASDIENLKSSIGNLREVSKVIGISAGMLNQFLSVFKLPKTVLILVEQRKIDSVAIVYYLSKFKEEDIISLAELIVLDSLSTQDLRVLLPFRKQYPNDNINDLADKIQKSKNIKVSVIRLNEEDTSKSIIELKDVFSEIVGIENLLVIEKKGENIDIKLTKSGEKILREKAKIKKLSFQELISKIIN